MLVSQAIASADGLKQRRTFSGKSHPVPGPRTAVCSSSSARAWPYDNRPSPASGRTPRADDRGQASAE